MSEAILRTIKSPSNPSPFNSHSVVCFPGTPGLRLLILHHLKFGLVGIWRDPDQPRCPFFFQSIISSQSRQHHGRICLAALVYGCLGWLVATPLGTGAYDNSLGRQQAADCRMPRSLAQGWACVPFFRVLVLPLACALSLLSFLKNSIAKDTLASIPAF